METQTIKKIRYFSDFCSSQHCKEKVEFICESHLIAEYGQDFVLTDQEDYTHAIILNCAMPVLSLPRENVIGFAFEPPDFLHISPRFIQYAKNTIGNYYIGEKGNLPAPFQTGYAFMWHILPPSIVPKKTNLCSMMVSDKKHTRGHRYRHELAQHILSTNLPIDIYGRGCRFFHNKDSRIKGEFIEADSTMYEPYLFHIAIENTSYSDYISEKVLNPLLQGTTPIYWGAKNIGQYFPDCVYEMSGNLIGDLSLIYSILREPLKNKKNINISLIKEKTNILKNIDTLFS